MNAWSHLPNAHHIDRVLESVKSHPEIWATAWDTIKDMVLDVAWNSVGNSARSAARSAALSVALSAALDAALDATLDATTDSAWSATRFATVALIAYDDASKYLEMPSDKLRVWALLSEDPAAVLLLPAVIALERINELECEL